jgi:predicted AAA+ superfamily ATPase
MILRDAAKTLKRLVKGFPIVAITGPRQAGKRTLAKAVLRISLKATGGFAKA